METMNIRNIGTIVSIFLITSLILPIVNMLFLIWGHISIEIGVVACILFSIMLFLSTRSFLIVWEISLWTQNEKLPQLIGATVFGSLFYCCTPLLVGVLLMN